MDKGDTRRLYRLFAELLDYPGSSLLASAMECIRCLECCCPDAAEDMRTFLVFAEGEGREGMEEVYTRTFDITPTTNLYVGYHLFGESFKRGAFLARLQERYCAIGFMPGTELADHVSVMLRFASIADDAEFVEPLLDEGILPALEKVVEAFKENSGGYGSLIRAIQSFVRQDRRKLVVAGG